MPRLAAIASYLVEHPPMHLILAAMVGAQARPSRESAIGEVFGALLKNHSVEGGPSPRD